jgi:hypothetical protein
MKYTLGGRENKMLKYTKQQWQNRRFRQVVGVVVIVTVVTAAILVTIAVTSDNEPEVNNLINTTE